jgi:hypothetical protein
LTLGSAGIGPGLKIECFLDLRLFIRRAFDASGFAAKKIRHFMGDGFAVADLFESGLLSSSTTLTRASPDHRCLCGPVGKTVLTHRLFPMTVR